MKRLAAAAAVATCVWLAASAAFAHPHVWVTVRSQIVFSPDGKVAAVVHDWVFDEMYSSFATQGLAKPGELVKRETFAPLAKENAGGLADIGYFTTLKIGGKAVDFGNVTDYWMEERPDHLVTFHVVLPLKTPTPPGRYFSLLVADPEYFIDFEFDDNDAIKLDSAPSGCSASIAKPPPLDGRRPEDPQRVVLHRPAAGSEFRLQDGQPRDRRLPVKRILRALPFVLLWLWRSCATRAAPALAQLAHRPFEVGGGEGGGGANGGVTGWLLAEQSQLTHLIAAHVKALHGDPAAMWGLVGLGFAYGVFHAAGPGTRQGGDRLLHDGQRSRAEARRRRSPFWRRCCRARSRSRWSASRR